MAEEIITSEPETYYHIETYEEGTSQTLNFKPEIYQRIQNEKNELTIENIFKTKWFERNKEVRYLARKNENIIDITTVNGKARINLITDEYIKKELSKLPIKEAKKLKNIYFGGIEFTIKAYFQKNIDTPIEIYILDDRILGNIQDALITVVKGNLIYQKLKFTVQPDFSISLTDEHKDLALTLYYKLDGIKMPPGSKVISIETKMVCALTGNHHIKRKNDMNIVVPKLYTEILEQIEHKGKSKITIPEEISIDFNHRQIKPPIKTITHISGSRLSFKKEKIEPRLSISQPRKIDLINTPQNDYNKLKIKTIVFNGIIALDCLTEINIGATRSLVHINKVEEKDCKIITEPQIYNYPNTSREIIITKITKLRFKIHDLEYKITIGIIENDTDYELLLGNDFLSMIRYKIVNEGIEIEDQNKIRFINKL